MNKNHFNRLARQLISAAVLVLVLGFSQYSVQAQHSYPRIASMIYRCSNPEWAAKYDMLLVNTGSDFVQKVKAFNPDIKVLYMIDWNVAAHLGNGIPDNFRLKTSSGAGIGLYGWTVNPASSQLSPNFSDVCPQVNGIQCNEWFADYICDRVDFNDFDGLATDGLWGGGGVDGMPSTIPLDMDMNGINDWTEHSGTSSTRSWIKSHWNSGLGRMFDRIRSNMGSDKYLVINSGWGLLDHPSLSKINGAILEYEGDELDPAWKMNRYQIFINSTPEPHATIFPSCDRPANPFLKFEERKNNFMYMRFCLTKTLMGSGYYGYTDRYNPGHLNTKWYDDFETELGFPTTDMIQLGSRLIWVRFFDNGAAICNMNGSDEIVTDSDLQGLTGYNGPYFRFKGGQDPGFNNGSLFNEVSLFSRKYEENYGPRNIVTTGDGIILVKSPTTIVSEIVIDNDEITTSPASETPQFIGSWTRQYEYRDSYAISVAPDIDFSGYACTGNEGASAVFAPTISVAGLYKVYEWHGYHYGNEGTHVNHTITHANGSLTTIINQQADQGQWNELGMYYFAAGNSGNVTISSNGANGTVIADAIKFVYEGSAEMDEIPPNPPGSLQSESGSESTLFISWGAPAEASDGDIAFLYQIYRDGELVGTRDVTNFMDEGLSENTAYSYAVYTFDDGGNMSTSASTASFVTQVDTSPPKIVNAIPDGLNTVIVTFDEAIDRNSAENVSNYQISNNLTIVSAVLLNLRSVQLNTHNHDIGMTYTISVNSVYDRASNPNSILPNSTADYVGDGGVITIDIAADDLFNLYLNGIELGTDNDWQLSRTYTGPSKAGKNVIAIRGTDIEGLAGVVAQITFNDEVYVSDDTWMVNTELQADWETVDFNDQTWQKSTSFGAHGVATPWADYANVVGMPTDTGVEWIWSSDNENDNTVYLRYTIWPSGDNIAPNAPTGLRKK